MNFAFLLSFFWSSETWFCKDYWCVSWIFVAFKASKHPSTTRAWKEDGLVSRHGMFRWVRTFLLSAATKAGQLSCMRTWVFLQTGLSTSRISTNDWITWIVVHRLFIPSIKPNTVLHHYKRLKRDSEKSLLRQKFALVVILSGSMSKAAAFESRKTWSHQGWW